MNWWTIKELIRCYLPITNEFWFVWSLREVDGLNNSKTVAASFCEGAEVSELVKSTRDLLACVQVPWKAPKKGKEIMKNAGLGVWRGSGASSLAAIHEVINSSRSIHILLSILHSLMMYVFYKRRKLRFQDLGNWEISKCRSRASNTLVSSLVFPALF